MSASLLSICHLYVPKSSQIHGNSKPLNPKFVRYGQTCLVIKCCNIKSTKSVMKRKNYYELLGVSVDSDPREIKEAYRKLQKKYHPDIAGQEGHEYTLMLNEAYKILMRDDLRLKYDSSIGQAQRRFNISSNKAGLGYSTWNGPLRSKALFVDGNVCIGCRECVHHASNTFFMDEAIGEARVKVQFGDDDRKIEVSIDSCPVNCIHWVDKEELPVLEFLIQPQPKEGYGVFGGGWERHKNVFDAAKYFNKQLDHEAKVDHRHRTMSQEEETPAQAEARANASKEIRKEKFSRVWNWAKEAFWF